jgi:hypothetical protein
MPPGDRHGDEQEAETEGLKAPADKQFGEVLRYRGHHAADDHAPEGEKDHISLAGAIG